MMIFMSSLPQRRAANNRLPPEIRTQVSAAPGRLERLEVDVPELDAVVVALEADKSLLAQDTGVLFGALRDVIVEVGVHQHLAVVHDGDLATVGDDPDRVPFADVLVR